MVLIDREGRAGLRATLRVHPDESGAGGVRADAEEYPFSSAPGRDVDVNARRGSSHASKTPQRGPGRPALSPTPGLKPMNLTTQNGKSPETAKAPLLRAGLLS